MRNEVIAAFLIAAGTVTVADAKMDCSKHLPTPEALISEISSQTAREVLKSRFNIEAENMNRPAWVCFQEAISSGDERWLKAAEVLLEGSHAGATHELIDPLSQALLKNPEAVLRLMSRSQNGLVRPMSICNIAVSHDIGKKRVEKEFSRFRTALQKRMPIELRNVQTECLNQIEAARLEFFTPPTEDIGESGDW